MKNVFYGFVKEWHDGTNDSDDLELEYEIEVCSQPKTLEGFWVEVDDKITTEWELHKLFEDVEVEINNLSLKVIQPIKTTHDSLPIVRAKIKEFGYTVSDVIEITHEEWEEKTEIF